MIKIIKGLLFETCKKRCEKQIEVSHPERIVLLTSRY